MADEHIQLNRDTIVSAREIDEVVSHFRLQKQKLFAELPRMTEADLVASGHRDDVCPICFNTLLATLAEEEVAHVMDSPAHSIDDLGVTRLQNTCGHIFCRKDITKWISEGHDSCPSCRRPLYAQQERREGGIVIQPGEDWLHPWLVDSHMVARSTDLPTHLPTLSVDGLGSAVTTDLHQFIGMYS